MAVGKEPVMSWLDEPYSPQWFVRAVRAVAARLEQLGFMQRSEDLVIGKPATKALLRAQFQRRRKDAARTSRWDSTAPALDDRVTAWPPECVDLFVNGARSFKLVWRSPWKHDPGPNPLYPERPSGGLHLTYSEVAWAPWRNSYVSRATAQYLRIGQGIDVASDLDRSSILHFLGIKYDTGAVYFVTPRSSKRGPHFDEPADVLLSTSLPEFLWHWARLGFVGLTPYRCKPLLKPDGTGLDSTSALADAWRHWLGLTDDGRGSGPRAIPAPEIEEPERPVISRRTKRAEEPDPRLEELSKPMQDAIRDLKEVLPDIIDDGLGPWRWNSAIAGKTLLVLVGWDAPVSAMDFHLEFREGEQKPWVFAPLVRRPGSNRAFAARSFATIEDAAAAVRRHMNRLERETDILDRSEFDVPTRPDDAPDRIETDEQFEQRLAQELRALIWREFCVVEKLGPGEEGLQTFQRRSKDASWPLRVVGRHRSGLLTFDPETDRFVVAKRVRGQRRRIRTWKSFPTLRDAVRHLGSLG